MKRSLEALREGGRATRGQLDGTPKQLGARAGGVLSGLAAILGDLVRGVAGLVAWLIAVSSGPLGAARKFIGRAVDRASRVITPVRTLLAVAIGCAVLLGLSQFADYRGIAVGVDNFDGGVNLVAPPPEVERAEAGSAHSYAFVPAAVVAIGILGIATRTRRWRLCRLAALIGVAAVVVAIVVDRPTGLDEGAVAESFSGVQASLLGGFWAQIFSAAGLAATSLLLGRELRRAVPRSRPLRAEHRSKSGNGERGEGESGSHSAAERAAERAARRARPPATEAEPA